MFKHGDLCKTVKETVRRARDENEYPLDNGQVIPAATIVEIMRVSTQSLFSECYFVWIPTLNIYSLLHFDFVEKL